MRKTRRSTGPRSTDRRTAQRMRAEPMPRLTQEQVEAEIATLGDLSLAALRERWEALYGNPAPRSLRRDLLIRAVAFQLQVKAFGGLSAATKRKLREIAARGSGGQVRRHPRRPSCGTRHQADSGLAGGEPPRARGSGRVRVERLPPWLPVHDREGDHRHELERLDLLRGEAPASAQQERLARDAAGKGSAAAPGEAGR